MADKLTPTEFQKKLMAHGFALPKYGADGSWGGESEAACAQWFDLGTDLNASPNTNELPVTSGLVPAEWMPDCVMTKIIIHWTAGSYTVSDTDKEHYHIIVDGGGKLHRGDYSILANVSTSDADGYAAHTKGCNTKAIGVSAACMAGAIESPFSPGVYPLKQVQWETLAAVVADLSRKYKILVSATTILQHGEVQKNLGIAQNGKWDICKLPWAPSHSTSEVGNQFRNMVSSLAIT